MNNLHPMVVHFPIALLLSAWLLDVLALVTRRPHLHRFALCHLILGVIGAGAAVLTGLQAEDMAKHSFEMGQVMELHERCGIATLILGVGIVAWRLWRRDRWTPLTRAATMTLMTALASTVSVGAYLGGRLVYELGIGGSFGR